jgi:hypothetical protein
MRLVARRSGWRRACFGRQLVPIWAAVGVAAGEAEFVVPLSRKGPSSNGGHLRDAITPGAGAWVLRVTVVALDDVDLGNVGFLRIPRARLPAPNDGLANAACRSPTPAWHQPSVRPPKFGRGGGACRCGREECRSPLFAGGPARRDLLTRLAGTAGGGTRRAPRHGPRTGRRVGRWRVCGCGR